MESAMNGIIYWEAGGIAELLALDYNETEIHRSITGVDGEYTEISGSPIALVEDQEAYYIEDTDVDDPDLTYYKVRHHTALGKVTEFSDPIGYLDSETTTIDSYKIYTAWVSHDTALQGSLRPHNQHAVWLLRDNYEGQGNRLYQAGTDYLTDIVLTYEIDDVVHGVNLTGSTIAITFVGPGKTTISKTSPADIALLSQAVDRPDGGDRGACRLSLDHADLFEAGIYTWTGTITWADTAKTFEFTGLFEVI